LAIFIAQRPHFPGQAVPTRGLSFAFFHFCSLFVIPASSAAARRATLR
jgi:hypothetical protein